MKASKSFQQRGEANKVAILVEGGNGALDGSAVYYKDDNNSAIAFLVDTERGAGHAMTFLEHRRQGLSRYFDVTPAHLECNE